MTAAPTANPSRATLQSTNAFLFSPRRTPPPPPLAATFARLGGASWSLSRTLTSALPPTTMPSATFAGTATFTPRAPTAPGYAAECVYAEEGVLRTEAGVECVARRGYVWRLREGEGGESEGIEVWFVKEEGGESVSVDGLFLDLEFGEGEGEGEEVVGKGRHLCGEDLYRARFVFASKSAGAGMVVRYVVKGPRKDYVSESRYTR